MDNLEILFGLTSNGFDGKKPFDQTIFKKERIEAIRIIIRENLKPIKNISNRNAGFSYALKHRIEDYAKITENPVLGNYITNGECIYAMYLEGYKMKKLDDCMNAQFGVSVKSFETLLKKINEASQK